MVMLVKWVAAVVLVAAAAGCAGPARTGGAPAGPTTAASAGLPGLPASPRPSSTMRCLTGTSHFSLDEERGTPELCMTVGATVDLPARAGTWAGVRSSDPRVVTCEVRQDAARCQAGAAGRATVTASDGSGTWQLAVFVG